MHLQPKSREISFAHFLFLSHSTVLKLLPRTRQYQPTSLSPRICISIISMEQNGRASEYKGSFQYKIRRLIVRSREASKPRDLYLESSDRSEISLAPWCILDFVKSYDKTSYRILKPAPGNFIRFCV